MMLLDGAGLPQHHVLVHDPRRPQRVVRALAGHVVLSFYQDGRELLFRHAGDQVGLIAGVGPSPGHIPDNRAVIAPRPHGVALVLYGDRELLDEFILGCAA